VPIDGDMTSFDHTWVSVILSESLGLSPILLDISRMTHLINPSVDPLDFSQILCIPRK